MNAEDFKMFYDAYREMNDDKNSFQTTLGDMKKRNTKTDGIPVFLALDDLTKTEQKVYSPVKADEGLGVTLALDVIAFADLVEQRGELGKYPAVCTAMSAIAEKHFRKASYDEWKEYLEGEEKTNE